VWNATGSFRIGSVKVGSTVSSYFTGQVSQVQTWNTPLVTGNFAPHCSADVAVYGLNTDNTLTYKLIEPATGTVVRRLKSATTFPFTPGSLSVLNNNTLLVTNNATGTLYRVDIQTNVTSLSFAAPVAIGTGWTFLRTAYDGTYFYGITTANALRRYTVTAAKPSLSDFTDWTTVGTGFSLSTLTSTAPSWIIGARTSDGLVRNYHVTSGTSWVSASPGNWGTATSTFSPGGGLYYVRSAANSVTLYYDSNPVDLSDVAIPTVGGPVADTDGWNQTALSAQPGICS
jgi:hypothetical protein